MSYYLLTYKLLIFSIIICGPGSLDREPGIKGGSATMDIIWGLTVVTPGAIAASAIYVSGFSLILLLF